MDDTLPFLVAYASARRLPGSQSKLNSRKAGPDFQKIMFNADRR
jgi:hypothetical protein